MVMLEAGEILKRRGLLDAQQLDKLRADGSRNIIDSAIQQGIVQEEPALRCAGR